MHKFGQGALCVLIASTLAGPAIAAPCNGANIEAAPIVAGAPLTLDMALRQVRQASPDVQRAVLEARARQADADQAGRRLNPSINLEVENFIGSGPLSGFGQSETTLSFEQTLQLGGKRQKREFAARARAELGTAECETLQQLVQLEAATLFYDIVAAQEVALLAKQASELADTLVGTVTKRVEAGAAAPPELLRVRSDAARLKAASIAADADIERMGYELAALWGSPAPTFSNILNRNSLNGSSNVPIGDVLSHPDIALANANEAVRQAELIAAQAAGVPDLTVSAGLRRFEDTGDSAFLLGVSVPFPLFDRNRDAARASTIRADSARINAVATRARLRSRQQAATLQVETAKSQLALLENEALPTAREAYDASVKGYTAGRFDLTTTLNARKELIDASVAVVAARRELNMAATELQSLISAYPFNGDFQ